MNRRGFFGMLTEAIVAAKVEMFGEEASPQFEWRKLDGDGEIGPFGGPLANPHKPGTIEWFLREESKRLTDHWIEQLKKP